MTIGPNKRKLNKDAFYLDKNQIEITYKYKYLEFDFYSHGYFEPLRKRQRMVDMKALMKSLRKETIFAITCWELKFHLFKAYSGASDFYMGASMVKCTKKFL